MARSVFYYYRSKLKKGDKYRVEKELIKEIFDNNHGCYGYRRITAEMRSQGYAINHKTVQKLMTWLNIKCQIRRVRYRSYRGEIGKIAPNVLNRDFSAARPNEKWATDVTQININEDRIFLSPIIDLFNGEVVSYSVSSSQKMDLINDMLNKAFDKIENTKGIIFHSDQGWQYQHSSYQLELKKHGIIQSMSRKGNCLDNAMAENFFGIMKSELLYPNKFHNVQEFMDALDEYIYYYNNVRIKSRLNGMSPVKYREKFYSEHEFVEAEYTTFI